MPSSGDSSGLDPATIRWLVGWGLTVWAAVAVTIRLTGHVLLSPNRPVVVIGFFLAVVPLMAAVTYPVYHRLAIVYPDRPGAAAIMSLPGLFLDVVLVRFASTVFPAMPHGAVLNFVAILLFGYGIVLLTGFLPWAAPTTE